MDVHEKNIVVVRQIDGSLPQPAQRFENTGLLKWVAGMIGDGCQVHSCYEAGCFGYSLHRQLCAAGAQNRVVVAKDWCGNDKTDKRDAREMCLALERFVRGNTRALSQVRVPTAQEEARREAGRHRQRLLKERQRLELRGGGLLRKAGFNVPKGWWRPAVWDELKTGLPAALAADLGLWQQQALLYEQKQSAAREVLAAEGGGEGLPLGLGGLTWRLLSGEIVDWRRFNNRRQVASYTGLCPGEKSSGERQKQGGINRHGNPRVRTLLIEAVWRLARYEKGWRGFKKFPALLDKTSGSRRRRKAVAAAARLLAIDLWRLALGRSSALALGFSHEFGASGP
jgi:transposase